MKKRDELQQLSKKLCQDCPETNIEKCRECLKYAVVNEQI